MRGLCSAEFMRCFAARVRLVDSVAGNLQTCDDSG